MDNCNGRYNLPPWDGRPLLLIWWSQDLQLLAAHILKINQNYGLRVFFGGYYYTMSTKA
jgi:hypothetical protein